ncbi:MAG: hypothetical protein IJ741_03565 [Schwartzia sp.]|nr:hypothetical protein [Schwartzia sp. (in: firmicutes)]
MKYEIYLYDVWGNDEDGYEVNDVLPTGTVVGEDVISEDRLCKVLGLGDPAKMDIDDLGGDALSVDYDGKPYCELRRMEDDD